jgi:hypothetical protein
MCHPSNDAAAFVSTTDHSAAFNGLASVSSDVDPETLGTMLAAAEYVAIGHWEHPLPNGKTLIRQDYRPESERERPHAGAAGLAKSSSQPSHRWGGCATANEPV